MSKKKILAILLSVLCSLACAINFSSCVSPKNRESILRQLREIPCIGEYALIGTMGYSTKTDEIIFYNARKKCDK